MKQVIFSFVLNCLVDVLHPFFLATKLRKRLVPDQILKATRKSQSASICPAQSSNATRCALRGKIASRSAPPCHSALPEGSTDAPRISGESPLSSNFFIRSKDPSQQENAILRRFYACFPIQMTPCQCFGTGAGIQNRKRDDYSETDISNTAALPPPGNAAKYRKFL